MALVAPIRNPQNMQVQNPQNVQPALELIDRFLAGARVKKPAKKAARKKGALNPIEPNIPKPDTTALKSWIAIPREYRLDPITKYINALNVAPDFEKITTPKDFPINLLPHQLLTVKAMLDIEQKRTVNFWKMDGAGVFGRGVMECGAAVLREALGAGKTYEALALIMLNPTVRRVKEIASFPMCDDWYDEDKRTLHHRDPFLFVRGQTETRIEYRRKCNVTLIFVAKNVISQWCEAIQEHTDLKTFVIADVRAMHEFYNMTLHPECSDDNIENYDVVLVKNGNISGRFDKPELVGTCLEHVKSKPIITVFSELYKDTMWKRIILDDFDILGVPPNAKILPSLFTWFISTTKKQSTTAPRAREHWYDLDKILDEYRPTYLDVRHNAELFTFASVANTSEYTSESVGASKVNFHVYKFVNPNEQVVGALNAIATGEVNDMARDLAEMLNADAVSTAAKTANVSSKNPADIFKKILDNRWDDYNTSAKVIAYAEDVTKKVKSLPLPNEDNKKLAITAAKLDLVKKNVEAHGPKSAFVKIVKLNEDTTVQKIKEVHAKAATTHGTAGKAIERVKANLKDGICPIMAVPFSELEGVVIMTCCSFVLSLEAAREGLKPTGSNKTKGVCSWCRTSITSENIVMVDRSLNLDTIIEHSVVETEKDELGSLEDAAEDAEDGDLEGEKNQKEESLAQKAFKLRAQLADQSKDGEADDPSVALATTKSKNRISDPSDLDSHDKYNCLVKLITSTLQEAHAEYKHYVQPPVNIKLHGLMQGKYDKGEAPPENKKALIFANFGETLEIIQNKLDAAGITFSTLHGTHEKIREMVKMFNLPNEHPNSIRVLLVNGAKYCAGLNLQAATDLFYMHFIVDPAVEAQIAGRIARIGRMYNANIHFILYNNEHREMMSRQSQYDRLRIEDEAPAPEDAPVAAVLNA